MEKTHNGPSEWTVVIRGEAPGWGSFKKVPRRCKGDNKALEAFASFKSLTIWILPPQLLEMDGSKSLDGVFKCPGKKTRDPKDRRLPLLGSGVIRSHVSIVTVDIIGKQYRFVSLSSISLFADLRFLCSWLWIIYLLLLNNKIYYGWFTVGLSRRQIWVCNCLGRLVPTWDRFAKSMAIRKHHLIVQNESIKSLY